MEISASEINLLCRRISSSLPKGEYSISSIYSIEGGLLLRLRHTTLPEKLVAISAFASWITTKNLALPEASHFVSRIRDLVERQNLAGVEQVGNERIARFSLESRKGARSNLYAEFFAGGNQILTEPESPDSHERIVDVANPQRFRHRALVTGEAYTLPPARGVPLEKVSAELLMDLIKSEEGRRPAEISAVRWFGRSVGTSRKFVEEIFFRSGVDPDLPSNKITLEHASSLARACSELTNELEQSSAGFVLLPSMIQSTESGARSSDTGKNSQADDDVARSVEVDVCPLIPHSWEILESAGQATIERFPSFGEALDEAHVQSMIYSRRRKASKEARAKSAELASAIRKQELLMEKNSSTAKVLRTIGETLMHSTDPQVTAELLEKLRTLEIVEIDEQVSGANLRFVAEPRAFVSAFSGRALASRLFDEAKRLEESNRKILSVQQELISERSSLEEKTLEREERAERRISIERRPREWFERYRWFFASDGSLVVGGRDATSNSVIINKYTSQHDIVFHADLHGSPFFVLRGREGRGARPAVISEEVTLEIAQATVSFSRAWKDELGSADAYWVYADQVKKSAPSGEYLPRGSFFIEGKKNFMKHLKIELGVGLLTSTRLAELLKSGSGGNLEVENTTALSQTMSEERSTGGRYRVGEPHSAEAEYPSHAVVVCGPGKALANYCFALVKIAPGKEKASSISKRIKQSLISKVKEDSLKNISKRVSIDEIMRVLPSGNYNLVSEKQNR